MADGKHEFYSKAEDALTANGYRYFDGDRDIKGKGRQHANKPDYIAAKGNAVIIGEIKSPAESPKSGSWRQIQNSDTEEFKKVRMEVANREKAGLVSPEVGGHEIIICGQIADYVRKIGTTFELPESITKVDRLLMGYTIPKSEEMNVMAALKNSRKSIYKKIDIGNSSVTFIFY
ncbi:MAG TPA: hypothetical protein PLA72_10700 [Smithellaceae bacterium]|mgnify:FL=1|nr:hypothetical protein [Smithellaceae bacterium]